MIKDQTKVIVNIVLALFWIWFTFYSANGDTRYFKAYERDESPKTKQYMYSVRRDGEVVQLSEENIVLGDVVCLDKDTKLSMDFVAVKNNGMTLNVACITGECLPLKVYVGPRDVQNPLEVVDDSTNFIPYICEIADGSGEAVVIAFEKDTLWNSVCMPSMRMTSDFKKTIIYFNRVYLAVCLVFILVSGVVCFLLDLSFKDFLQSSMIISIVI